MSREGVEWDQHMNPEIRCKDSAWGKRAHTGFCCGLSFLSGQAVISWSEVYALCGFTEAAVSSAVRTCAAHAVFILAGVELEGIQWVDLSIMSLTLTVIISHTLFFTLNHHSKLACLSCFELQSSFMQYHSQPTLPWTWMNLLSRVQNDVWLTTRGVSWLCSWSGGQCKLLKTNVVNTKKGSRKKLVLSALPG